MYVLIQVLAVFGLTNPIWPFPNMEQHVVHASRHPVFTHRGEARPATNSAAQHRFGHVGKGAGPGGPPAPLWRGGAGRAGPGRAGPGRAGPGRGTGPGPDPGAGQ